MAPGFTIAEVRFRGENVEDAVVRFAKGLSVVGGPSNTGKSLLRSAINFVFGSGDPMKTVDEAAPYRTILVEIRTANGAPVTFERAWQGGDIKQYQTAAQNVNPNTPSTLLAAKHSADDQENISAALLSLAGLAGTKILRYKGTGEIGNLSFRFVRESANSRRPSLRARSPPWPEAYWRTAGSLVAACRCGCGEASW